MPNASVHTEHSNATFIFLLLFSFVGDEQLKKQFQFNERMIFLSFYSLFFCFFCVFTRPRIEVVAVKCEEKWIHVDEECVDQLFTALFFFRTKFQSSHFQSTRINSFLSFAFLSFRLQHVLYVRDLTDDATDSEKWASIESQQLTMRRFSRK